jgi:hypothetical protein
MKIMNNTFRLLILTIALFSCNGEAPNKKIEKNIIETKPTELLKKELDSVLIEDQKYRQMAVDLEKKIGNENFQVEMNELMRKEMQIDSSNLFVVKGILDKYGWLGADEVGSDANATLFLVIQHSDLKTQEEYFPLMKEAVKNGKARAADLALLTDRIEMNNGRPQVYGSQMVEQNGKYVIYTMTDEPNVNKRRAEVGLEPLEEYAKQWDIIYKPVKEKH